MLVYLVYVFEYIAEIHGCILAMPKISNISVTTICKDILEDDAVWLMLWDYFLYAAKSYDIHLKDGLTSDVLVAKAGSTEESILIGLDLAGFKVELDT